MTETDTGRLAEPPLLEVENLFVEFRTRDGVARVLNGVSYSVDAGETLAVLGESGSGKSVTAQAIMGILDVPPAVVTGGEIRFRGENLLAAGEDRRTDVRAQGIAMIFQDALSALNPVFTVGWQIREALRTHQDLSKRAADARAIELLEMVGIPNPPVRFKQYPHEFSGGMRQRAMIAMALANDPHVLLADEPTTALDVTVQAQIMALLEKLQEDRNTAIVLITHDLGVVASYADRINVMYAGKIVESGTSDEIFYSPRHAYTYGLLSSLPRMDQKRQARLQPIKGIPPSLAKVPQGCPFHPRCAFATDACLPQVPTLELVEGAGHFAACVHSDRVAIAHEEKVVQ